METQVEKLKLSEIVESPFNPREDFDQVKLAELGADMKDRGQLQPIIVRARNTGKGYELVDGARRWRASQLVELATIDAIIRVMTDLEAEEAQLVENGQPLKPLERARGYQGLIDRHNISVDDLALKLKKSRSTVYATLSLARLEEQPKKALIDGGIAETTAKMLANLPAAQQVKATEEILTGGWAAGEKIPMTVRLAHLHLQQEYFLDLRSAVFNTKDAALDPKAGACTTCPKRSDNQKDIFGGKKQAPLCLDSGCWGNKTRLGCAVVAAERGLKLLEPAETDVIFSKWGEVDGANGYLARSRVHPTDAKDRTYAQLLTPTQLKDFVVLALNPKNELVELLRTEGLKEAIEATGKYEKKTTEKRSGSSSGSSKKLTVAQKEKQAKKAAAEQLAIATRDAVLPTAVAAMVAAVVKAGATKKVLTLIAKAAVTRAEFLAERRKIKGHLYNCSDKDFAKHFGKLTPAELLGLVFEATLDMTLGEAHDFRGWGAEFQVLADQLGVDLKKLELAAAPAEKSEKPAKKKAA